MKFRMNRMRWIILLCLIPVIGLASGLALTGGVDNMSVSAAVAPASVTVTPEESYNPIRTQHTFTATVKAANGSTVDGAELHWILPHFATGVGAIIDGSNISELSNTRAVAVTDSRGQATMTICSMRPGDTDLIVYVPGIADATKHKAFAVKHWEDIKVAWPPDATNKIGTEHVFAIEVTNVDGLPLANVKVNWTITDDTPNAKFKSNGTNNVSNQTDAAGKASVTLQQVTPAAGDNVVTIEVLGARNQVLFKHDAKKTWQAPALNITKTGPDREELGKTVLYTIKVTNDGDDTAGSVDVVDTVPAGLTYLSSTPSAVVSGNTLTWSIGDLAVNRTSTITARFSADQVGVWTNVVKATSAEGITDQASAITTIYGEAVLDINKTGPAKVTKGDKVQYSITVKNIGNIAAQNTVVTDSIPACLAYDSSSPAATVAGGVLTWNVGNLASGAQRTFDVTFTAAVVGTCTNTAEAVADNAAKVEDSVITTIEKQRVPDISITKTGPSTIYLKATGTYTITVENNGEVDLTNVVITDTLPANLTYQSSTPGASISGKTLTWTLATLNEGATRTITLVCQGTNIGSYVNNVSVVAAEGVTANAAAPGIVVGEPGMTMQITDTTDPVQVGGQTTYQVTLKNQGEITIHNLKLVLNLPASVSYVSASGPLVYTVAGQQVTFDGGATLAAGQQMQFAVTVRAVTPGPALCTATMTFDEFALPVSADEGTTIYTP